MYRLMKPSDEAAVLALWQNQHHDTEDFAKSVLERFAGVQNIYVAEENDAIIRAIHPWGQAYIYHNSNCIVVTSYITEISENNSEYTEAGTIVDMDYKERTLSILCGNNKIIKLHVGLYKKYDRPFTSNYIKRDMCVGMKLY